MQIKNNSLRLVNLIRSKAQLIYILSNDEPNTIEPIRHSVLSWFLNRSEKKSAEIDNVVKYFEWSLVSGLQSSTIQTYNSKEYDSIVWKNVITEKEESKMFQFSTPVADDPTTEIMNALTKFQNENTKDKKDEVTYILVIKDIHNLIKNNPMLTRKIKEICMITTPKNITRQIIILSPVKCIPVDLENHVDIIDWKLPDSEDIRNFLLKLENFTIVSEKEKQKMKKEDKKEGKFYTELEIKDITNSFLGLPLIKIEEHACQSYAEYSKTLDPKFLSKLKTQSILENSSLELIDTSVHMDNVGGMNNFKDWVKKRNNAFSKEAQEFGVESPKGVMLVGIQGCGKTLMSRAIASLWSLPLIKFDVAKVFSKTIGSSEENIRNTLSTIEALSPCVVQIDEIEKGLSGVGSSNMSDGGTTSRVVGTLLSWMQDKTAPAFIIATANDVSQLPPELLRKGRFDEIFFCSLPEEKEREEIFRIHLEKRNKKAQDFKIREFAVKTKNYSGAEIEQVIKSAILFSFESEEKKLTNEYIFEAIKTTIPLYSTCKMDIDWLLTWVGWDEERQEGLRARFSSSLSKDNHADPEYTAELEGGKKRVIKLHKDKDEKSK